MRSRDNMKSSILKKRYLLYSILGIAVFIFFLINFNILDKDYITYDRNSTEIIRKCVSAYIYDSLDYDLKFGADTSILDVNELLLRLTFEINIQGKKYGPYLTEIDEYIKVPPSNKFKNGYKGWKITVDKNKHPLEAVTVEHYKYNLIEIVEN